MKKIVFSEKEIKQIVTESQEDDTNWIYTKDFFIILNKHIEKKKEGIKK
jgi:hypothetical protein